jgi:hypothetical protein
MTLIFCFKLRISNTTNGNTNSNNYKYIINYLLKI